ncbi:hypothetical protein BGX34_000780 [Mortierella sp. NVP85]|nr:hypothetical protein BGX34_000780 [Mortierella sp. NVP85]
MHGDNPLEIPELIWRISRYVTMKDAVACAQVCKAWTDHFVSAIWHTISFEQEELNRVDPKALAKYGHHIREVWDICSQEDILILLASNPTKLRRLSVDMDAIQQFYAESYAMSYVSFTDLLRRVNASLERIEIFRFSKYSSPHFAVDCLFPAASVGATSRLSSIQFQGMTMTRDSLSLLLQNCPLLRDLNIRDTKLLTWPIYDKSAARYYQSTGVARLVASIEQVFNMNQEFEDVSSLFVHFPNLKSWQTWISASSDPDNVSTNYIRTEVARCCPLLKELFLETNTPMTVRMLTRAFDGLTSVRILKAHFSAEMVMAILNYRETLRAVATSSEYYETYDFCEETIPRTTGNHDAPELIAQFIPRLCTRLERLELPFFEMDMSDIEMTQWGCHDLEELYIVIRGLDTEEKVNRAIQLWKEGRIAIKKKQANGVVESALGPQMNNIILPGDNSIEARVARHLLKFKKLRVVWLGWTVWRIA